MRDPVLTLAYRAWWVLASLVLLALVAYGSLSPPGPTHLPGGVDKVEHFAAYLFLAVWFTGLYPREHYWPVALFLVGLGLAMELLQFAMHLGRDAAPLDMAANVTGVATGMLLATVATGGWAQRVEAWLGRR